MFFCLSGVTILKKRVTMENFIYRLIFLICLYIISYQAYSQDIVDTLDQAVITATRSYVNRNQTPMTINVVNRQQIEDSGESALLPVLSKTVPGLFVTERGVTGFGVSAGSAGTVSIRGVGGGNKVLMMFDGQPQWAGIFGHHLPDTYVASDMDRVEVVRGPASLLYGSSAMGGVVNMITRNPQEGFRLNGRLMYGSYNTQKYMVNAGFKNNKFNGIISFNHDRTDGHRDNSEFKIYNGYAKVGYEFSQNWNASVDAVLADFMTMNPGTVDVPAIDNRVDALRGTISFSIDNRYEKTEGAIKGFYSFGNHKVNDGWKDGVPRDYLFRSNDYNRGLMAYQIFKPFKNTQITAGLDYKQWGGKAWNDYYTKDNEDIIDTDVEEFAVYVLAQQKLWNKLTLNAGVRLEINETYWTEIVPQFGLAYQLSSSAAIKAIASKGFRSPNLRELYLYAPANPDLKPERMMNYDITLNKHFFNRRLNVELTGYFIKGSNMIQTQMEDGKPKNMNTGDFIHRGIEFAADYKIIPQFNISTIYSYLHMNEPLVAAPEHQAYIMLKGDIHKFSYMFGTQYIGGLYLNTNQPYNKEYYFLLNAKLSYKPIKYLLIFLKGENLTDHTYSINNGFPMPGFIMYGGININI